MHEHLILGGTGKTGRRVARLLGLRGRPARTGARTPGPPAPGIAPVRFDWDDARTWAPALDGVQGVWLVPPALRLDAAPLITRFLEVARTAGAGPVVLLSARGADHAPGSPLFEAEHATAAAGLPWAVVRPTWFMQNFSEGMHAGEIAAEGRITWPSGGGEVPFVDAEDIAAVAVSLLEGDAPAGRGYDLSGPEALTAAEAAALIAEAAGRPVRHVDPAPEAWEAGLRAAGVPADYAALLGALTGVVREGADAHTSDGVREATGRAPRTFAAFAAREAAAWRAAA